MSKKAVNIKVIVPEKIKTTWPRSTSKYIVKDKKHCDVHNVDYYYYCYKCNPGAYTNEWKTCDKHNRRYWKICPECEEEDLSKFREKAQETASTNNVATTSLIIPEQTDQSGYKGCKNWCAKHKTYYSDYCTWCRIDERREQIRNMEMER